MSPARLPSFLRLNDARKTKAELFASLSPFEVEILAAVATGSAVLGDRPGAPTNDGTIVVSAPIRSNMKVIPDGQKTLDVLTRKGWLRFAASPVASSGPDMTLGYFWLTDSAERLWRVLGLPVRD